MKKHPEEYKGDWSQFDKTAKKWGEMLSKLGVYGLADLLRKTPSYQAYDRRWPFDFMTQWRDVIDINDPDFYISADQATVEEEAAARLDSELLEAYLTPKQKKIYNALREGKTSVEIEKEQGYQTNNAVRWHKHQIKKKYQSIKQERYDLYYSYVCKECGWVFDTTNKDQECPSCSEDNKLLTKRYHKPVFDLD